MRLLKDHALFVVLLILVAAYRFQLWHHTPVTLYGDMLRYNTMALHVIDHGYLGFRNGPDAYVMPLYPLFLAVMYKLLQAFHTHLTMLRMVHETFLLQQGLSLLSLWLTYQLGSLFAGKRAGFAAAILSALYLPNSFVGLTLLTEPLFIPLLLGSLLAGSYAVKRGFVFDYALTGLLIGLTALVRPNVLPLFLLVVLVDLIHRRNAGVINAFKMQFRMYAIMVAFVIVPLIPWWIRNAIDFHHFIPLSTEAGNPLLAGADPYFLVGINTLIEASRKLHESQQTYAIHYMLHGLTHQPLLFLGWYLFGKLPYLFWTPWFYNYLSAFVLYHRVLVILGGIAMIVGLWYRETRFFALSTLFLLAVQLVFLPITRYGYPLVLMTTILVPAVICHLPIVTRFRRGGFR
ncbi:glycosyltransferase family 39 protein [Ferroacidibacillus organovorans]|uniref:Uncharacterized protein n=1 Tax=Ferroacidibacillus organovorans TaxID=1765683 RepID=A0A162U5P9_9BACL|nr:glycosyltransferase family 39 protein [Ferroacidibacillus organovorans]KYP81421.1 hypothetical protein AYJ22_01265 [Ferroacidibacillus organovorans]OAG95208.1 hypothetical protein AYW79_01865 [Ferroacidibacillus organovorans]OPG15200.1 hypothetical protein B2M26_13720 [Ferroacidibacillus organovorans]